MTETWIKIIKEIIGELLSLLWLILAFFVGFVVFFGQKINTLNMPSFRSLTFGQKPKENGGGGGGEVSENDDVNNGFLNRKIVVERVKNVFGKTLKQKEKLETDEFDIKKVMKIFHGNNVGKKSVTFADRDEVIDEIATTTTCDFETTTSFCEEKEEDEPEVDKLYGTRMEEKKNDIKNLIFHEDDENFNSNNSSNYTNLELWKSESVQVNDVVIKNFTGLNCVASEPPPLPPKLHQKYNFKTRPSVPPPLPPKSVAEPEPPVIRRDLKKFKSEIEQYPVVVVVEESSSVNNGFLPFLENSKTLTDEEEEEEEGKHKTKVFFPFEQTEPVDFLSRIKSDQAARQDDIPTTTVPVSFTTFKPEITKKDCKENVFQVSAPKSFTVEKTKPKFFKLLNGVHGKSSKIPKLVEEMIEKKCEKKFESFDLETLKKCKINVSNLVNNFEQIEKDVRKNERIPTNGFVECKTNRGVTGGEINYGSPSTINLKTSWIIHNNNNNNNGKTESDESGSSSSTSGYEEGNFVAESPEVIYIFFFLLSFNRILRFVVVVIALPPTLQM